jgi:cellulose synthase/poly-beta-1,6-N-acetylglucosamine synthase-like glycosyltransferase
VFDFETLQAGKGLALDFGVKQSTGEYLLVLDSDGLLDQEFIETALPLFNSPTIAAVQGKLLTSNRNYNIVTKMLALEADLYSIPFMTVKGLVDRRTPLGGTGYIVRKDILQIVGGFGNALIDDFELSFRLFRNKYRIAFAPLSIEYDEKPPHLALMLRQRSRWVKGHFDLLNKRVAETTDVVGNIYWFNPILMLAGFFAMSIVSF